jgi:hypothetical protein
MTLPTIKVEIDFTSGPSFGYPFILDSFSFGILDTNILADGPADIVDISAQVRKVSTRRGRNRLLSQFEAGTATVTLNDPNSDFNPQNVSSPYYGKLLPLRKIRIYAITTIGGSPVEVNLFSGYITSYDTSFYQGTDADATVTLKCVDGFRLLANVSTEIPPIPGATAGQLSGARIETLLDFADFPDSLQNLNAGNSTMMADPGGNRSVLQAIQTIEQSEFGGFFMGRSGKATFLERDTISKLASIGAIKYTDVYPLGVDEYPYSLVDFAFDDQLVLNDVTVTRYNDGTIPAPVPQTVIDQTSIDTYFYKSGQRTGLLMETDAEALSQAQMLVASRKNAQLEIQSMIVNLNADVSELNTALNLNMDIYQLIDITKTMPGGSTINRTVFVQGVNHDVTPTTWNATFYTSEPIIDAFILDSSTNGILDVNALTY